MGEPIPKLAGRADESFQTTGEPVGLMVTADAASTFVAELAQFVRRYPSGAVAAAFGAGMIVGWFVAHELKTLLYTGRQQQASEDRAYKRAISRWEGEGGALLSMKKKQQAITTGER